MINFIEFTVEIFKGFEKQYDFKIEKSNTHFSLRNKFALIDIYFENYFEVNAYLKFVDMEKSQDIELKNIVKYFNVDKNIVCQIPFNQISSNEHLIKYMKCVRNALSSIIDLFKKDRVLFDECMDNYIQDFLAYNDNNRQNAIFSLLNNLWNNEKYTEYILNFQKYDKIIFENKKYSLANRRALYIKNNILN